MRLTELDPQFMRRDDDTHFWNVDTIDEADGIRFLCPKCFAANEGPAGTHSVLCWRPRVPQTTSPKPGRWEFQGTSFDDLTLVAGSSSVALGGGCQAHFFIRAGGIVNA